MSSSCTIAGTAFVHESSQRATIPETVEKAMKNRRIACRAFGAANTTNVMAARMPRGTVAALTALGLPGYSFMGQRGENRGIFHQIQRDEEEIAG
jgi:hypothetical protein